MVPFEPAQPDQIEERFKTDLSVLDDVIAFCDRLGNTATNGRALGHISRVQFVTLFHFVKALKSIRAVQSLFTNGFEQDAEMILRVLIEQAILVRWINTEDADDRARAYALYLRHKQHQLVKLIEEVMPEFELPGVSVDQIKKSHEEYKQLETREKWYALTRNLFGLAAETGMQKSYVFYAGGTDLIHSNPTREADYIRGVADEIWFNTTPSMPDNGLTPIIAAQHMLFLADVFNDVFGLSFADELATLMERAQQPPRAAPRSE